MGRNALVLVREDDLFNLLVALSAEYRSDVPLKSHEIDARAMMDKIIHPSF